MRILYLCHRIPYPPNKGEKIRAFHQLRAMAVKHEVDMFTLADDSGDLAHEPALRKYCHGLTVARVHPKLARLRALPFLLTRTPLTIPYFYSAELQAQVQKALAQRSYDRIFVYCSAMAQYVGSDCRIPMVLDLVDVDSDKWMQYSTYTRFPYSAIYRREGRCLREYEREACERSACVVVSTGREASLVRQISSRADVEVVPNGVDTAYFDASVIPPEPGPPSVIFTGDMSYFPNSEAVTFFAREVLPLVRRRIRNARFLIVGRNPGKNVRKLEKIDGVEVTGFVPDVRQYLAKAQVAVAPFSIAAGIQNKLLEAMAYGLPVVATPRVLQGLSPAVANIVETGEDAADLAQRVLALLEAPKLALQKGREARRLVKAEYSWDHALNRLLQVLENVPNAHLVETESNSKR